VVIPARHDSTRLPGKVLLPVGGKPLLQWVYERARSARAAEILIATDDERVIAAARAFGAEAALTSRTHASGSDRIAELARLRRWGAGDIIVNLQGDEPLMPAAPIEQVAAELHARAQADIATLATPVESLEELLDPNVVKVVCDPQGMALYFSRAPIPWERDATSTGHGTGRGFVGCLRHRGIYAYRVAALLRLAQLPVSPLEQREKLEQLRALENGLRIHVGTARERPGPDVNTHADLERVAALLAP
jgi:3-deoxy-manno-octulosonate cytidylyltransferase (CMP-KDO synthetase)